MWSSLFGVLLLTPFHFNYRKRWEADRIQGERKNYIFDLDHNRFGEEGPIQNQYSVDSYTKGALFPRLKYRLLTQVLW